MSWIFIILSFWLKLELGSGQDFNNFVGIELVKHQTASKMLDVVVLHGRSH